MSGHDIKGIAIKGSQYTEFEWDVHVKPQRDISVGEHFKTGIVKVSRGSCK